VFTGDLRVQLHESPKPEVEHVVVSNSPEIGGQWGEVGAESPGPIAAEQRFKSLQVGADPPNGHACLMHTLRVFVFPGDRQILQEVDDRRGDHDSNEVPS